MEARIRIRIRRRLRVQISSLLVCLILISLQFISTISLIPGPGHLQFQFQLLPGVQRQSSPLSRLFSSTRNPKEASSLKNEQRSSVAKLNVSAQKNNTVIKSRSSGQDSEDQQADEPLNTWLSRYLRQENGSPEYAEEILMQHIYNETLKYDTVSFNICLSAWAKQKSMAAARRADSLLTQLLQHPTLNADSYSYSAVLHAYAKSGGGKPAALRAEELLYQMTTTWVPNHLDVCHNAVIDAWSQSGDPSAGRRAQRCLEKLQKSKIEPTRVTYNGILKAYGRSPGGANEALKLLREMQKLGGKLSPNMVSFTTVIDAYCKELQPQSLVQAELLLEEMEEKCETHEELRPDIYTYSSMLHAYAETGNVAKAMRLRDRLKRYAREEPNTYFLNILMHLFAKAKQQQSAETLFESMIATGMEDKITYTALISAHANKGNATRALQLLEMLEQKYNETESDDYLPNERTFGAVLVAIANSSSRHQGTRSKVLDWINDLYERMDRLAVQRSQPQEYLILYIQMFSALAKLRDTRAAHRALQLLDQMQQRGISPDSSIYANLINTLTKSRIPNAMELASSYLDIAETGYGKGNDMLRPTKMLYSACLQAYAKSASAEGAEAAEKLLQRTKDLYQKGRLYAKPTSLYYNAVMDAHARSRCGREAALRAEELLGELEVKSGAGDLELRPTTRTYNAAILAWKNSNEPDAPQRAEALLKRMNDRYKAGDEGCRPDRVTINSIISVWAKSGQQQAPKRAEDFLKFMEELWAQGDESLRPDRFTFNAVIDAHASSGQKFSARRADELFKRMKDLSDKGDKESSPDIVTFTSLLHAWEKSDDQDAPEKVKQFTRLIYLQRREDSMNFPQGVSST
jgi:pentatricopeptide repeat protein